MATANIVFDHIGLHVGAIEDARTFFSDYLGLDEIRREELKDPVVLAATGGAALAQIALEFPQTPAEVRLIGNPGAKAVDARQSNPGTCHIGFYTSDMDAAWGVLDAHGTELCSTHVVSIEGGVFDGGKALYCVGPEGIRVELLEGAGYLDGSARDPTRVPAGKRANEASHFGLHVRDRARALAFWRDLLGCISVAEWLEKTPSTRAVVGFPETEMCMAILRLPGTQSFFELIEYRNVARTPVDNTLACNGVCHISFSTDALDALEDKLQGAGVPRLGAGAPGATGTRSVWYADPDGYRIRFVER